MTEDRQRRAVVVGGGPAGLMAAEVMSGAGLAVTVCEAMPTPGRKLLMAGKSGLNLTRVEPAAEFLDAYGEAAGWLTPMITEFDSKAVRDWAEGLGQPVFTGSTGRVFPTSMKASPLLRAWLGRLAARGVDIRTRRRWAGWDGNRLSFVTPAGPEILSCDVAVMAMGGASWSRLGSDGRWADAFARAGIGVAPFRPANSALSVNWSAHMAGLFGAPVKGVRWCAGTHSSRGEAIISARGLEGGGIYAISRHVRDGAPLCLDLLPDRDPEALTRRISGGGKASLANRLRKTLRLDAARRALLQEFGRPLPTDPADLAALIKSLPVQHEGLRPMDEAISTAGGVRVESIDDDLMLRARPGTFCAGEMLDWEAPTGGYLLTACLATGRWAGLAAARRALAGRLS